MQAIYLLRRLSVKTGPSSLAFSIKKMCVRSRCGRKGIEPRNGTDGRPGGKFPAGFFLFKNVRRERVNRKVPENTAAVAQSSRDKLNS